MRFDHPYLKQDHSFTSYLGLTCESLCIELFTYFILVFNYICDMNYWYQLPSFSYLLKYYNAVDLNNNRVTS